MPPYKTATQAAILFFFFCCCYDIFISEGGMRRSRSDDDQGNFPLHFPIFYYDETVNRLDINYNQPLSKFDRKYHKFK